MGVPPFLNLWREVALCSALLPYWVSARPAVAAAAWLAAAYGLFAYVRVAHGKEAPGASLPPLPYESLACCAVSLTLVYDIGIFN